jgi:ATP-dependent DNA ligase
LRNEVFENNQQLPALRPNHSLTLSSSTRLNDGLVSKHRDRLYQDGRSKHWIKVKNRKHPAMEQVTD